MSDASDKAVVSNKIENVRANDAITRAVLLKWAIISIYGVAKGWDSVVALQRRNEFWLCSTQILSVFFLMYVRLRFQIGFLFFLLRSTKLYGFRWPTNLARHHPFNGVRSHVFYLLHVAGMGCFYPYS